MSDEQKKANRNLPRYEDISLKLNKVVETYLTTQEPYMFYNFIMDQKAKNVTHLNNHLIEVPKVNIVDTLKKQYISKSIIKGEIGTIPPEDQEYEIKNMALLMLMSNRLSKVYEKELANNRVDNNTTRQRYLKNRASLLSYKCGAISDIIANIYVLQKIEEERYKELFSYGERLDKNDKPAFFIDLPYVGQISVHFGHKREEILEEAKNKILAILEKKRELGQIDDDTLERLKEEIQEDTILPQYEGKLYENVSALPIEYIGPRTKAIIKELGLDTKLPEEIEKEDIEKMIQIGLNEREAYYLAIKLGCPKGQLKEVMEVYSERKVSNETIIGQKSVEMTTAQERATVLQYEQRNLQRYRQQANNRAIGG